MRLRRQEIYNWRYFVDEFRFHADHMEIDGTGQVTNLGQLTDDARKFMTNPVADKFEWK